MARKKSERLLKENARIHANTLRFQNEKSRAKKKRLEFGGGLNN